MPFVLGATIPGEKTDYLVDPDYPLPISPVKPTDEAAWRIGQIIARNFARDGTTLQYSNGHGKSTLYVNAIYGTRGRLTDLKQYFDNMTNLSIIRLNF